MLAQSKSTVAPPLSDPHTVPACAIPRVALGPTVVGGGGRTKTPVGLLTLLISAGGMSIQGATVTYDDDTLGMAEDDVFKASKGTTATSFNTCRQKGASKGQDHTPVYTLGNHHFTSAGGNSIGMRVRKD